MIGQFLFVCIDSMESTFQEIVVEALNQQQSFANLGLAALELQSAAHADPLAQAE